MKAYIVKKIYNERKAICCYLDSECKELSWAIYTDNQCENTADLLFDKLYELKIYGYKIEFKILRGNENEN